MLYKINYIFILIIIIYFSSTADSYKITKSRVIVRRKYVRKITNHLNRTSRVYFPLFEMVEFPNEGCLTVDGLMGTCYARTECDLFRGITRGFCARGFGVCCLFRVSCGGAARNNRTHFLSPQFPQSFNQEMRCQISVTLPTDACQLRLNFVKFLVSNPKHSQCAVDALSIPHSYNIPTLCGNLTGQHMYLESNDIRELLIIVTTTGTQRQRYWIIEMQFIQCDLVLRAPIGCLQYYTGVTGLIKTMNFDCDKYIKNKVVEQECLIANLEYNICIRIESQRCAIQWTAEHFDLGPSGLLASQRGDYCQENYITIQNAKIVTIDRVNQNLRSFDRFCGKALNIDRNNKTSIPLISRAKPFQIGVTSAKQFSGALRGASLSYEQRICIEVPVN